MPQILIEGDAVRYLTDTGFDHLYLVFRTDAGVETVLRGGPSGRLGSGTIVVEDAVPMADSADARPLADAARFGSRPLDLGTRAPEDVWDVMRQHGREIAAQAIPFASFGTNSNSVVASVLHVVGIDIADTLPDQPGQEDVYPGTQFLLDTFDFVLTGTAGADRIAGAAGNDVLRGGAGDDTLTGGAGRDTLAGDAGRDLLGGGAGSDRLEGGADDDFLNPGWGHDRALGGAGADRFFHAGVAGHGADWIEDFSAAEGDLLVFGGLARPQDLRAVLAETPGAGGDGIAEAFVVHAPTGRILWAVTDGAAQDSLGVMIGGQVFDLFG